MQPRLRFAGPLARSEQGRVRALVIVDAESQTEIDSRLADDPGSNAHLATLSAEPWRILVGEERLAAFLARS